jgi:hypothetical protein
MRRMPLAHTLCQGVRLLLACKWTDEAEKPTMQGSACVSHVPLCGKACVTAGEHHGHICHHEAWHGPAGLLGRGDRGRDTPRPRPPVAACIGRRSSGTPHSWQASRSRRERAPACAGISSPWFKAGRRRASSPESGRKRRTAMKRVGTWLPVPGAASVRVWPITSP